MASIHEAVKNGDLEMVKMFLAQDQNENVNPRDKVVNKKNKVKS
jgi:hypothetical protein